MTAHIKVSGVWKEVNPKAKIDGVWKELDSGHVKVAGIWKEFYSAVLGPIDVSKTYFYIDGDVNNPFLKNSSIPSGSVINLYMQLRDSSGKDIKNNLEVETVNFSYGSGISFQPVEYLGDGVYKRLLSFNPYTETYPSLFQFKVNNVSGEYYFFDVTNTNVFVAVANSTPSYSIYSSDKVNWTTNSMPNASYNTISFGEDGFIAISSTGLTAVSRNGVTWETRASLPNMSGAGWNIADQKSDFYGKTFIAVSSTSVGNGLAYRTTDSGKTWTARTLPGIASWRLISHNGAVWTAIAENSSAAATSTDGITWTSRTLSTSDKWKSIAYGNNIFSVISTFSNKSIYSTNGITWTTTTLPSNTNLWNSIAYGNGTFVALGGYFYSSNAAATSTNGITWTARTLPTFGNWVLSYGVDTFVAINRSFSTVRSTNGITWTIGTTLLDGPSWSAISNGWV